MTRSLGRFAQGYFLNVHIGHGRSTATDGQDDIQKNQMVVTSYLVEWTLDVCMCVYVVLLFKPVEVVFYNK